MIMPSSAKQLLLAGVTGARDLGGPLEVSIAVRDAINSGRIEADGGNVLLTARSANALLDTVINNSGIIRANSLIERNGEIVPRSQHASCLLADGDQLEIVHAIGGG